MKLIDLHVHSNASDGSYSPEELVRLAQSQGLKAMALTDHDTIEGCAAAVAAGEKFGVEVISGVEISARFPGGSMHILGLGINFSNGHLGERLAVLQRARAERNPQIIAKLNALGLNVTMDQVEKISGGGQIGRPHIARALFEGGFVSSIQEAFDIYLKNNGRAYVPKFRFPPEEAIAMIREARGVPVLSHPFTLGLASPFALGKLVQDLMIMGLAGIEVFYADHTPEQEALYLRLARRYRLLVTGGSDFHGLNKPEITLGRIPSQRRLTYKLVEGLKAWRQKNFGSGAG